MRADKEKIPTRAKAEKALSAGADPQQYADHPNYHVRRKAWVKMGRPLMSEDTKGQNQFLTTLVGVGSQPPKKPERWEVPEQRLQAWEVDLKNEDEEAKKEQIATRTKGYLLALSETYDAELLSHYNNLRKKLGAPLVSE